jgi:hypothetical protein
VQERLAFYQTLDSREQPDEGVEVDEKNDQIALRRIVAGREILRNDERNSNSPETGLHVSHRKPASNRIVSSGDLPGSNPRLWSNEGVGAYLLPTSARAVRGSATHPYSSSIIIPQQIRGFSLSRIPEARTLTYRRRPNQ